MAANPTASADAKAILNWLVALPDRLDKRVISGQYISGRNCAFFDESEQPIEVHLNGNEQQAVQRFVARQFGPKNPPFRVDIRRQPDSSRIETRYL